jgi:hypothetical protein
MKNEIVPKPIHPKQTGLDTASRRRVDPVNALNGLSMKVLSCEIT